MRSDSIGITCPAPIRPDAHVQLAHGGGGRLTSQLLEQIFMPAFANPALGLRHDGAHLDLGGLRLVPGIDQRLAHCLQVFRLCVDGDAILVDGEVFGAGVDGQQRQLLAVLTPADAQRKLAARVELPGDGA